MYKQVVDWYDEARYAYLTLTNPTSEEIWAQGEYAEAQAEWIQVLYEKREALHEEVEKSARNLKEMEEELKETKKEADITKKEAEITKKEAEVLKAELLQGEVAKETGEGVAKKLVEQKDKWERLAKKTKEEKEELEKNLRQQLQKVKLVAKRAPTTTAATQTRQIPPLQLTTQTEKPTYASVAT